MASVARSNRVISVAARGARGEAGSVRRLRSVEDLEPLLSDAAHYPGGRTNEAVFPTNEAELAAVLAEGGSVLVVGAQSSLTGGATPRGERVISMARMNRVLAWKEDSVVVEAGLVLAELAEELEARDLYYPPIPTYDGATVGGTVATNAAGAATFKYGTTRAWIRSAAVMLACGCVLDLQRGRYQAAAEDHFVIEHVCAAPPTTLAPVRLEMPRVPKLAAGYWLAPELDLLDLFIGAEGTLGVVMHVELGLRRGRPAWFVALIPLRDDAAAVALTDELRRASRQTWREGRGLDVAAIEYMDSRCLEILREDGAPERLGVSLARDAGAAVILQAELEPGTGADAVYDDLARIDDSTVDTPMLRLARVLEAHGVLDTAVVALPGEDARRRAIFALREAVPEGVNARIKRRQREVDPTIAKAGGDVIVPFERFADSLARYRAILAGRGLDHAIWGHISDGNVHPNILPADGDEMRQAMEALAELGEAAIELGGAPMSEHGVGRNVVKQALLERLWGPRGLDAMRSVKRALDPHGRMAPGVLWAAQS
jgi:D-lactate dehydrogenase (cytochrome)